MTHDTPTSLVDVLERPDAIARFGERSLSARTVRVYMVTDPRIELGSYFEELDDGTFYCLVGFEEIHTPTAPECVDFLVKHYPSE